MNNVMEKACKPWHVGVFLVALLLINMSLLAGHVRAAEPPVVHEPIVVATESHKKLLDFCIAATGRVLAVEQLHFAGVVYTDCMAKSYLDLRKKAAAVALEYEKKIEAGGL